MPTGTSTSHVAPGEGRPSPWPLERRASCARLDALGVLDARVLDVVDASAPVDGARDRAVHAAAGEVLRRASSSSMRGVDRARVLAADGRRRARRIACVDRARARPASSRSASAASALRVAARMRCGLDAASASAALRRSSSPWSSASRSMLLDLVVVEAVARLDLDLCSTPVVVSLRVHAEQAVGVDAEGDLEPRQPGGHRRDALEHEAREAAAVGDQLALALHDVDVEAGLVVLLRREGRRAPRAGWSCCAGGSSRRRRRRSRCRARAGCTSRSSTSSLLPSPARRSACIAAPSATTCRDRCRRAAPCRRASPRTRARRARAWSRRRG